MNEHPEKPDRAAPTPGTDIEANARVELESAEGATDAERLETLDRLYMNLEGVLES